MGLVGQFNYVDWWLSSMGLVAHFNGTGSSAPWDWWFSSMGLVDQFNGTGDLVQWDW